MKVNLKDGVCVGSKLYLDRRSYLYEDTKKNNSNKKENEIKWEENILNFDY